MRQVKILGTGHYVPENIVTNDDLAKLVDTSDEWIVTRTGIKERRITSGEDTSELAAKAAIKALEDAKVSPDDLDLIIVATITADKFTPSTACMVQSIIGAGKAVAFDVNAACTGFIYGISIGSQFIKSGQYEKVLVIGAEVLSKIVNWEDRNTCVLFGDGAGAAVLGPAAEGGILNIHLGADGSKGKVLDCHSVALNNPYIKKDSADAGDKKDSYLAMEGREVFRFATTVIGESIEELLKETNITKADIAYIVPHQANMRIIDYASKRLDIDVSKFYVNLDKYGNTSSASIPIALDEMNKNELLKPGDKIVLVGFGGGLTYGSVLVEWQ